MCYSVQLQTILFVKKRLFTYTFALQHDFVYLDVHVSSESVGRLLIEVWILRQINYNSLPILFQPDTFLFSYTVTDAQRHVETSYNYVMEEEWSMRNMMDHWN
jgi:hypothetical protein